MSLAIPYFIGNVTKVTRDRLLGILGLRSLGIASLLGILGLNVTRDS